jgi:hypothetical protein
MNDIKKTKQDETHKRIQEIIRNEYPGEYPLQARQCLHWSEQRQDQLLIVFLPDLERVLREEGKTMAADMVSAIEKEVRESM